MVDTGSSVTIISAKFFDKIARKMKKQPLIKEAMYKIQGVTGHLEKPRGEVKDLPLRFQRNGLVWNLNACITEATAADIILGTNFLIKYGAMLDLPRQQLILTKTKEYQEVIPLIEKKQLRIRMVSVIEQMDIDQPQERDAMEVDYNPSWKCSEGSKEFQCMKRFIPDDVDEDPEPCVKCHNRYYEQVRYAEAKAKYDSFKYTAHSDSCASHYRHGRGYDEVEDAYAWYKKGTQLKPNGDIVDKNVIYGNVGSDWTKYHPEWKPTITRKKDPRYKERTKKWKTWFIDVPEEDEIARQALEAYEEKHRKNEVYELEIPYVIQRHKKRQVKCEIQESHCIINDQQIEWEEVRKMQTKFTKRPERHERPYHYKGPATRCWDRIHLNGPDEHCEHCVWMVQVCRAIAALPDKRLTKLEAEGKLKARVRLSPWQEIKAPFPTNWQELGDISFRRWTPNSKPPKLTDKGYVLYSNEDVLVKGSMAIPTGIDLQIPQNATAMLCPYDPAATYVVNLMTLSPEQRVQVHVIAPFPTVVRAQQAVALLILIPRLHPAPETVALGQKVQEKPSPFLQVLEPEQKLAMDKLLRKYEDIFAEDLTQLGQATIIQHRIETIPGRTAFSKRYKQSWESEDFITAEIERMQKANIIEQLDIDIDEDSRSTPFAAPVVIVGKKDGSKRFCVDYR